jgi:hypothetical protein
MIAATAATAATAFGAFAALVVLLLTTTTTIVVGTLRISSTISIGASCFDLCLTLQWFFLFLFSSLSSQFSILLVFILMYRQMHMLAPNGFKRC